MEKIKERTNKYGISVRNTSNGYYEARTSIKLGGGNSKRLQKGGKTQELAVLNLLVEFENFIDISFNSGAIISKIDEIVPQKLVKSINDLGMVMPEIMQKTLEIINKINEINAKITNSIYLPSNKTSFYSQPNIINNTIMPVLNNTVNIDSNNQITDKKTYTIEEVSIQWKNFELRLCVKSDDNPRPLSQKTVDGYLKDLNNIILPFFKKKKLLYINQINEEVVKQLLKSINGYQGKRNIYIVLNLFFQYLRKQKIVMENIIKNIDKPIKPAKSKEENIEVIEVEKQPQYLDMFIKENTDMSLLFQTMMLTGMRPEEACRTKTFRTT